MSTPSAAKSRPVPRHLALGAVLAAVCACDHSVLVATRATDSGASGGTLGGNDASAGGSSSGSGGFTASGSTTGSGGTLLSTDSGTHEDGSGVAGSGSGGASGSGGTLSSGGNFGSGGTLSDGEATGSGGTLGAGGASSNGGSGGTLGAGGASSSGGSGGTFGAGGVSSNGGATGSGGTFGAGGVGSSGGVTGNGGTTGDGGAVCVEGSSCYTGPADARDVGACVSGKAACGDEGSETCSGQTLPVTEICNDGIDNDCDGLVDDCGQFICATSFGGGDSDNVQVEGVAWDSTGNAVVTGQFTGTVDFGGKSLISAGSYDIFIAKYSPACKLVWAERFGTTVFDGGIGIAVAANDDIVVTGVAGEIVTTGGADANPDLGGGALTNHGGGDVFIARYTKNGTHIWSHLYGGPTPDQGRAVALAPNGDAVITGSGSGDFGGATLSLGAFVGRYSSTGAYVWSTSIHQGVSNGINTAGYAIAADPSGNVLVSGAYDAGELDKGVSSAGENTAFLAELSPGTGTTTWLKSVRTIYPFFDLTTDDLNRGQTVAATATSVIWAGLVQPPINFGDGVRNGFGNWDAFVANYSTAGDLAFSFLDGGPNADFINQLALDTKNNMVVVGQDYPLGVLVKYSSGGRFLWSKAFDTPDFRTVAVSKTNVIAAGGDFTGQVNLGDGNRTSLGIKDGFLTLYGP